MYRAGIELASPGSAVRLASVARHVTDCACGLVFYLYMKKSGAINFFNFVPGLQLVKEIHNLPRLRSRKSYCLIAERNGQQIVKHLTK